MPSFRCYPINDPNSLWLYCPSYGAAIAFSVLYGLATLIHTAQAFHHRKPFAWVLIMGALWETTGYICRTLSVTQQLNESFYTLQQIFIILAPLWINAFVYMCIGRMVHCFLPVREDKVFGIRARRITLLFVLGDIFSFLIQITGAMMCGPDMSAQMQKLGTKVYMAGVGVQLFFIAIFLGLAIKFHFMLRGRIPKTVNEPLTSKCLQLLFTLYAVLALIAFRNFYRLVEFSAGFESSITKQEWYTFVFDSVPMFLALALFNVFHPGRFIYGERADFSQEKKERKMAKKARKAEKHAAKRSEKKGRDEEKGDSSYGKTGSTAIVV
jgi:hypothetical protein